MPMINTIKYVITLLTICIYTFSKCQNFDLHLEDNLVLDTLTYSSATKIVELIGTENVGFKSGNNNKSIGKFIFHRDSSIDVENYNPLYPFGFYLLRQGRYIIIDSVIVKDGIFIFMDMKKVIDTSYISIYSKGAIVQSISYYRGNKRKTIANYKDDLLHGCFSKFDTFSNKIVEGRFKYGYYLSEWRYFYSSGQLKAAGKYGKKSFNYESKITLSGEPVLIGSQTSSLPVKIGKWYYYNEKGSLAYVEIYNAKGVLKAIKMKQHLNFFREIKVD